MLEVKTLLILILLHLSQILITAVVGISKLGGQRLKVWFSITRRPHHGWGQGAKKILKIELLNWLKMAKSVLSNDSFSNTFRRF